MFEYIDSRGELNVGKIIAHALLLIIAVVVLFGSFGVVTAGERGVKVRLGVIRGVVDPGPYVKFPLIDKVVKMDVRTQSLVAPKDAPLTAASNDLQDTRLAVAVNYRIDPQMVATIYQQHRSTEVYYSTVVEPLIVSTIKSVASQYTAAEQIQKRTEMTAKVLEALTVAFEGKGVSISKADITDIAFSDSFTQSIEAKVTAVQNAEKAKNDLERVKAEAQQQVETAKAQAEAIRIQAQAITQQGGEDYVKLKMIEKWDGQGCTSYCGMSAAPGLLIQK